MKPHSLQAVCSHINKMALFFSCSYISTVIVYQDHVGDIWHVA